MIEGKQCFIRNLLKPEIPFLATIISLNLNTMKMKITPLRFLLILDILLSIVFLNSCLRDNDNLNFDIQAFVKRHGAIINVDSLPSSERGDGEFFIQNPTELTTSNNVCSPFSGMPKYPFYDGICKMPVKLCFDNSTCSCSYPIHAQFRFTTIGPSPTTWIQDVYFQDGNTWQTLQLPSSVTYEVKILPCDQYSNSSNITPCSFQLAWGNYGFNRAGWIDLPSLDYFKSIGGRLYPPYTAAAISFVWLSNPWCTYQVNYSCYGGNCNIGYVDFEYSDYQNPNYFLSFFQVLGNNAGGTQYFYPIVTTTGANYFSQVTGCSNLCYEICDVTNPSHPNCLISGLNYTSSEVLVTTPNCSFTHDYPTDDCEGNPDPHDPE